VGAQNKRTTHERKDKKALKEVKNKEVTGVNIYYHFA
jgi:hypothetical protein